MAIVLRVAFNASDWQGKCKHPLAEPMMFDQCVRGKIHVGKPGGGIEEDERGFCKSPCWESSLCTQFVWHTWVGKWGHRALRGSKVFFVFKQPDRLYTLWAKSEVVQVNGSDMSFSPFKPLARANWITGLTAQQLVGKDWRQVPFRYVDAIQEARLDRLLEGYREESGQGSGLVCPVLPVPASTVPVDIKPHVRAKLERIAADEGRDIGEVVREAIGEWLKGRGA